MINTQKKYIYRFFLLFLIITTIVSPIPISTVSAQGETPPDIQTDDSGMVWESNPPRVITIEKEFDVVTAPIPDEMLTKLKRAGSGPNLIYYAPEDSGTWDTSDPAILSMSIGATTSDSQLFTSSNFYIRIAFANIGDTSIPSGTPFTYCLMFDGVRDSSGCYTVTTGLAAGYYRTATWQWSPLSNGDHLFELSLDIDSQIAESNELDNVWSESYNWADPTAPDFSFYTPTDWEYPINLSSKSDFSESLLYSDTPTYIGVGVRNPSDTASPFKMVVKIDGVIKTSTQFGFAGSAKIILQPITSSPSNGWHTVEVVLDPDNAVAESDEKNNTWSADFYWEASNKPNLRPYQPSSWDDAITISSQNAKHVIDTLTAGNPLYINFAVLNDGFGDIPSGNNFTVGLTLDDSSLGNWTISGGLDYGWYVHLKNDMAYTINTSGWHILKLSIDLPSNNIAEVNENDNTYERWFFVEPDKSAPVMRIDPTQINVQLPPNTTTRESDRTAVSYRDMNNLPDFNPLDYGTGALDTPRGKYILPLNPPLPDMRQYALPTSVNNAAKLPPVGDQGQGGSCVAWSSGYYSKTWQEGVDHGWSLTSTDHQFSVNYLWNQLTNGKCGGTYPGYAMKLLQEQGDAPYSMLPYSATNCSTSAITQTMRDAASEYKSQNFGAFFQKGDTVTDAIITQMKQWLANGEPIVIAIPVYNEFDNPYGSYCIVDTAQHSGQIRGGHAITIVDYNDSIGNTGKGGFRIINSWGKDYGCGGGFAYLTYDWVKTYASEAWWMKDIRNGNSTTTRDFTIYNDGNGTMEVYSIGTQNNSSWLTLKLPESLPFLIEPGQSKTVTINIDKTGLANTTYNENIGIYGTGVSGSVTVNLSLNGSNNGITVPTAGNPNPTDTAVQQPVNGLVLNWQPGSVPTGTTYDVRLGTSNPPTNVVCNDSSLVSCPVSGLRTSTTYYWRVVSQSGSQQVLSPVWTFTTGSSGSNPQPVVGGTNPTRVGYAIKKNFVITIYGSGFLFTSTARWEGTPLATTVINGNTIQAEVPYRLILRKLPRRTKSVINYVTVITSGSETSNQFPVIINANPKPVLSSISPTTIQKMSEGFTLFVTGKNFSVNSVVKFKGKALATTYIDSTTLSAYVPANYLKKTAKISVTVYTPSPSGGTSKGRTFRIVK